MARQIWLLRHGEAEPHGSRPDAERRLTARGEDQSHAAGRALVALGLPIHVVFTSPRVRARDTASLACRYLDVAPVEHAPLGSGFDAAQALELLEVCDADQRLLLVGHEPDLSQVVHDLTGGRIDLKKGGLVGLRLDGAQGELVALLRPRELDRISAGP
jgi:phosphohistidine phosphatase